MRFKALVHVRLRGSVSDAAGNAVMKNTHLVAPNLKPHLLRIGKAIDFWFDAESEEIARKENNRTYQNNVVVVSSSLFVSKTTQRILPYPP